MCAALLTFVCMLRYSEWNVVPIWFLYSSVLMVVRCADLDSGFFDVSLMFSLMFASVPYSGFFLSAGSVSQRKVALDHIPPRTNATFLWRPSPSFSQNLKSIPDCIHRAMPPSSGVPRPHPYTQKKARHLHIPKTPNSHQSYISWK